MPRIRSVHPDLCDDETMAEVTAYAERTFIRLWTHLDDKGRGPDNAKLLKGKLYPLHDDVTPERVERDLSELEACGLILRYEVGGKRLLCTKPATWARWQKPQHPTPSKLPAPEDSRTAHEGSRTAPVGVGVGVVGESSCNGGEGESEGEPVGAHLYPQAAGSEHNHAAGTGARLAARAASHAPQLSVVTDSSSAPASTQRETQP